MQLLKSRVTRIAGLLIAVAMLIGALTAGAGSVSADTGSFALVPAAGANSTGGGAVSLSSIGSAIQVQIDLSGARVFNTYNLAFCTNTGVGYSCTFGGSITTDATGSFHGVALVTATTQIDLVTLANGTDQFDSYQAVTGTVPFSTPSRAFQSGFPDPSGMGPGFPFGNLVPIVTGASATLPAGAQIAPDGTVMLPANGATSLSSACPVGYSGPLLVATTPNGLRTTLIFC